MGIRHPFVSAKPAASDATLVDGPDWNADHLSPPFVIPVLADAANFAFTNVPAALAEINGNRSRLKADLANVSQARITARVMTIAASGSPELRAQYSTDENTWAYLDGAAGPSILLSGGVASTRASTWVNLAAPAKADVFLRLVTINGTGTTSPAVGLVCLHVR